MCLYSTWHEDQTLLMWWRIPTSLWVESLCNRRAVTASNRRPAWISLSKMKGKKRRETLGFNWLINPTVGRARMEFAEQKSRTNDSNTTCILCSSLVPVSFFLLVSFSLSCLVLGVMAKGYEASFQNENIPKFIVAIDVQQCEHTKSHWLIHFKWVFCMGSL